MTKTHDLGIHPDDFQTHLDGVQNFELLENDREFHTGDLLRLQEWTPEGGYTGQEIKKQISHVWTAEDLGNTIDEGYCILGLKPTPEQFKEAVNRHLKESIKCHLTSVDFEPIEANGNRYYGTEVVLRSGNNNHIWRGGNYLLIPVDVSYEL